MQSSYSLAKDILPENTLLKYKIIFINYDRKMKKINIVLERANLVNYTGWARTHLQQIESHKWKNLWYINFLHLYIYVHTTYD